MKKAPEAFRTISEVAELLETPAHVLRFWESKFYQIRPVKRAGGRRYYRPDDVALINGIRQMLQAQGLTIRGAQRVLQEKGVRHVINLGADLPALAGESQLADTPEGMADSDDQLPEVMQDEVFDRDLQPVVTTGKDDHANARLEPPAPSPGVDTTIGALARPAVDAVPSPQGRVAVGLPTEDEPVTLPAAAPRLPQTMRQLPRDALFAQRERAVVLARRIDLLLDRMSEASGAGRW